MEDASKVLEFINVGGLLGAIVIFAITWVLGRTTSSVAERLGNTFTANRLTIEQISSLLRFSIYVAGSVFALRSMFSLSKEVLTVVGGTFVVTVGLVLKDQAATLLGGIIILVEKPFQVGDRVSFSGYYGTIKNVGLRSVTLVTLDDNEVTIPNSKFLTDPVASGNSGALSMLVQMDYFVGTDQDIETARGIVEEAVTSSCFFFQERPWSVLVSQVQIDSMIAVRLRAKAYVLELRYEKAFESDVSQRVLESFRRSEIQPPAVLHRDAARVA